MSEGRPNAKRWQRKMRCDRRSNIRKCAAASHASGRARWRPGQDWNLLAGMIGSVPSRIAAVVGGNDEQVAVRKAIDELRQAAVEVFQCFRIARAIAPVAIKAVEVDEISKQQSAVRKC